MTCPFCGSALEHRQVGGGRSLVCARYKRGCRFGFAVADDGRPVRVSIHEAPDRAPGIARAKDVLLVLAHERVPARRASKCAADGPPDYWQFVGAILDAEDVVTLGELRAELDGYA